MSLQPREWAAELGPAAMDYTFLWSRESGSSAWTLNFHHSTGHEVLEVPKICWKSEGPKPVFKVCLLSHVLPSLDVFPRMFKTPPTFLICRLWFYRPDPADLSLEPVQDCGVGLHKIFPTSSVSSPCLQCQAGMAAVESKAWKAHSSGQIARVLWHKWWSHHPSCTWIEGTFGIQSPVCWDEGTRVLANDWTQSLVSLQTYAVDKAKTRSKIIKM